MPLLRLALVVVSAVLTAAVCGQAGAAASSVAGQGLEQSVKAAYLYKFLSYVDWPDAKFSGPNSPIVVGIAGAPIIASELRKVVRNRTASNRRIDVREVAKVSQVIDLHALFIAQSEAWRLDAASETAKRHSILTVAESADALARGSVINFVIEQGRVRFEVSLPAAETNRLKLSSRLLAVAQNVRVRSR